MKQVFVRSLLCVCRDIALAVVCLEILHYAQLTFEVIDEPHSGNSAPPMIFYTTRPYSKPSTCEGTWLNSISSVRFGKDTLHLQ